jgi:hypothetical protein
MSPRQPQGAHPRAGSWWVAPQQSPMPADRCHMELIELPMECWDDPEAIWALLGAVGGAV